MQFRQQSADQAERVRRPRESNGIGSDAVDLRNRGQLASLFVSFYADMQRVVLRIFQSA